MIQTHAEQHLDRIKFPTNKGKDYIMERGRYTKQAYGRLGRNWMNAEDCVQEAYLKLLEHPPLKMTEAHFESYFATVVNSIASNMLRNGKQREHSFNTHPDKVQQYLEISIEEEDERSDLVTAISGEADPAERLLGEELLIRIKKELKSLPFKHRNNVALYVIYGHKPRDVSLITGNSFRSVYNSIQYFRKHMRGKIDEPR